QTEERLTDFFQRGHHLVEMEGGMKRLDLLHQSIGDAVASDVRNPRDVVDRLLRIELGALATDLVEDIDEVRLDIKQAKLEHREQADRARADDQNIGLDRLTHNSSSHSPTCTAFPLSWPALCRPSTSFRAEPLKVVDARDKPGHDNGECVQTL